LRFIKASPEQAKRLNPKELCEKLVNLGLIKIVDKDNKDNKVILDTLIRKFLLEKAQASEYLKQEFVNVMFFECKQHLENGNFRFAAITSHFEVVITLLLHFEEVANKYIRLVSDAEFDRLFMNVGRFYDSRGMYSAEFQWYGMWLEKANRRLGSHPCSTDTKLKNLEYMYAEIGKPPEAPPNGKPPKAPPEYKPPKAAQPGYKRALEICEQLLKQDPLEKKDLASSLYDLGELLFKESKYSAALPLYERIVKIVEDKEEKNNKLESDTQLKAKNSIDEAKSEAKKLIDKAQSEAEKLEPAARSEAENLIATAQSEAKKSIDKAQSEAEKLEPAARSEAENLIATAQSIALILRQETSSFNANAQEKAEAKSKGGKLISEAQSKGDKLISEAQDKSNELISKAQSEGGKLISEAQDKSNELISEAQDKSNELISKAQSEGDKLISKARKKVDVETNLKNDKSKADTKLKKDAQSKAEECRNGIHNNKSVF
jgi:cell division septum initiation protein DivIVA